MNTLERRKMERYYDDIFPPPEKTGFIYKISSPQANKYYIGSTTKSIEKRYKQHQSSYKSFMKGTSRSRCASFDLLYFKDTTIELIKEVKFKYNVELRKEEHELINKYKKDCINYRTNQFK